MSVPQDDAKPTSNSRVSEDQKAEPDDDFRPYKIGDVDEGVTSTWQGVTSTVACATSTVAWEAHTRGIGSKLLAKMGHVAGQGLGKDGKGRTALVPVVVLPKGKSLDYCFRRIAVANASSNLAAGSQPDFIDLATSGKRKAHQQMIAQQQQEQQEQQQQKKQKQKPERFAEGAKLIHLQCNVTSTVVLPSCTVVDMFCPPPRMSKIIL